MPPSDRTDQRIARLASRNHGVVTRRELIAAGVTVDEIRQRRARGSLLAQHPGVYRVGHDAPVTEARYLAAVRACGEGAVLSGRAAAFLYGLLRGREPRPEVTSRTERRVRGVRTRRCRELGHEDTTIHRGIPVTTVARTLTDLAPELTPDELARACHEAEVRYGTTARHVQAVLARRPRCPGAPKLRAIIEGDMRVTLSKLFPRRTSGSAGTGSTAAGRSTV